MKVLMPLIDGFDEFEAAVVTNVLRRADIDVMIAGMPATIVKGSKGMKVIADKQLDDKDFEGCDALVLVGGPSYRAMANSQKIITGINRFRSANKLIAAIGTAPYLLAKTGILDERAATISPGMERELPRPRSGNVIVDGKIVTAKMSGFSLDFALKIVELLLSRQKAEEVREQIMMR